MAVVFMAHVMRRFWKDTLDHDLASTPRCSQILGEQSTGADFQLVDIRIITLRGRQIHRSSDHSPLYFHNPRRSSPRAEHMACTMGSQEPLMPRYGDASLLSAN